MRFELYYDNGIFGGTFASLSLPGGKDGMSLAGNK
jgi:hypothetical protein